MDFKRLLRTPSTTPFRLQVDDEENARNTAANEVTGEAPGLREVGRNDPKPRDMKAKSFRHDAKIWHVYLEDAEKEAREQAELWRTGLESLLIFAGLFAAIVASFLIDSKKDLQLDSEQKLLNDIRAATLRQGNSYHAPTYTDTVNGLWAISLYLTLFSAIMGVLAKAWIAKYIPATSRHEASDAASRFMLDQQARNWYIQEVITLIPLLVQIATFLFLVGLFLQIFDDNKKLGYTLMIFCISGGVMYLVITGTHLFARTAPMNTPLSELLLVKINRKASDAGYFPIPTDGDKEAVLAHILYTRLIQSPKHSSLDAAVEEIKPGLIPEKWVQALCRGTTPGILAARLQQCITTVSQDKENRHSNILNQLTVFLWFAEIYDRELSKSSALQYSNLDNTFRDLLKTGKPLHRLNGVDVAHRPLLFTLTANVLAILPLSRQETPKEHDLRVHELLDRPWETALRKIESAHRAGFMLAACRGLVSGKRVLKITSAFILSQSFAKAASYMMESGAGAEWDRLEHEHQRKSTELLALQYLREVHLGSREKPAIHVGRIATEFFFCLECAPIACD
ncbi:hypothetical protein DFP72DRAFT_309850 [Ephemerocybe angulata]|uniref:DUF6535 domain-containing protein n=1 Tax=Ephemerocybe angulata TaxID=980116 RepID=A0A8H6LRK9_9AGAR|nr:hypothetical protein DFP72DRAFT_309850 [Tulosesus angulatus]